MISAPTEYLLCDKHYVSSFYASSHYILGSLIGSDSLIPHLSDKETRARGLSTSHR